MASGVCDQCRSAFSGTKILRTGVPHHETPQALRLAADRGCYICRTVTRTFDDEPATNWEELKFQLEMYLTPPLGLPDGWLKVTVEQISAASDGELEEDDEDDSESIGMPDVWGFYVWPTSDISTSVGEWTAPDDLRDPQLLSLISSWHQKCTAKHSCKRLGEDFVPTRLLRIAGSNASQQIKLVQTSAVGSDTVKSYCTVSHCWGGANPLKLLSSNVETLQAGVDCANLPTNYQEAIYFALQLGIDYIWIDSLCIIQDSKEDWQHEAARMCQVYRNSSLNIALAGAANSSEPSFQLRSKALIRPASVTTSWDNEGSVQYSIIAEEYDHHDMKQSKLVTRAWVMQELELAPRLLILGKEQVWYRCVEGMACETFPGWIPQVFFDLSEGLQNKPGSVSDHATYFGWEYIVEMYSGTGITYLSDRMIAVGGLAQRYGEDFKEQYTVGLWRSQLPAQLLWRTKAHDETYRPEEYRAPSWSWCSVEGQVEFMHRRIYALESSIKDLCDVCDVLIDLRDSNNTYGQVAGGKITLQASLTPVLPWFDGGIAVFDQDMKEFKLISTPQALLDQYGEQMKSAFYEGDECDELGDTCQAIMRGLGSPEDMTAFSSVEEVNYYCLPVQSFEFEPENRTYASKPGVNGLLLRRKDGPKQFVRVGNFEARGHDEVKHFVGKKRQVIEIL